MMSLLLIMLLAGGAGQPEITAYKVAPLPTFDEHGVAVGRLASTELPAPPLQVTGTNEFGYLKVVINGRVVYLRPADVRHTMKYCAAADVSRRDSGDRLGGAK